MAQQQPGIKSSLLSTVYAFWEASKTRPKFKTGDYVRISGYKTVFSRGYTANWGTEIFRISRVNHHEWPVTYHLKNSDKKPIPGCFYEQELSEVRDSGVYLVERVLKKIMEYWSGNNGKMSERIQLTSISGN
ncbi:hypothetical protein QAD02_012812 [Eretmocerus hayati]|uniref:Uncharacterized protein n=1 Tax=Eretmocerus hayati TaxID=131215 RepID=A0ACC2P5H3_9HYME|nr:hypothetical protein QAD02_012812 [Eretmocerus hayati]